VHAVHCELAEDALPEVAAGAAVRQHRMRVINRHVQCVGVVHVPWRLPAVGASLGEQAHAGFAAAASAAALAGRPYPCSAAARSPLSPRSPPFHDFHRTMDA
jgi:CO/xanthine dehydrogenase FAD-binding subunit